MVERKDQLPVNSGILIKATFIDNHNCITRVEELRDVPDKPISVSEIRERHNISRAACLVTYIVDLIKTAR